MFNVVIKTCMIDKNRLIGYKATRHVHKYTLFLHSQVHVKNLVFYKRKKDLKNGNIIIYNFIFLNHETLSC